MIPTLKEIREKLAQEYAQKKHPVIYGPIGLAEVVHYEAYTTYLEIFDAAVKLVREREKETGKCQCKEFGEDEKGKT